MAIFYKKDVNNGSNALSEDESRHCSQVLRFKPGDEILIFDGNGAKYHAILKMVSKRICEYEILSSEIAVPKPFYVHLAIAPTKSTDRMEWMVEKLCEIGVNELTFLETRHSERRKLKTDRLEKKAISAMKQSGNAFKLKINELIPLDNFTSIDNSDVKLIAHVDETHPHISTRVPESKRVSILIGPEGDFTNLELDSSIQKHYQPVSLGNNTLRTETAGFLACCMINLVNKS